MPKKAKVLSLPPARPHVEVPVGLSKTMMANLECHHYFIWHWVLRNQRQANFLLRTGTEFHEWRKAYVDDLIENHLSRHDEFKKQYIQEHPEISDDCVKLIWRDPFCVDWNHVIAAELFLSVSHDLQPLEKEENRQPGLLSTDERTLASGTLDLLLFEDDDETAVIPDAKTGFSTVNVKKKEPATYAGLVFVHYPHIQRVRFTWDFTRVGAEKSVEFTRADLPEIHKLWIEGAQEKLQAVSDWNAGRPMKTKPCSLCLYCAVNCSERQNVVAGHTVIGPIKTEEDAVRAARIRAVMDVLYAEIDAGLKEYLDSYPRGRLAIGNDMEARLKVSKTYSYPAVEALQLLGLRVIDVTRLPLDLQTALTDAPDGDTETLLDKATPKATTPLYDVPIGALTLGGLSDFAKTKKRQALRNMLPDISKQSCSTRLSINKVDPHEATPEDEIEDTLKATLTQKENT